MALPFFNSMRHHSNCGAAERLKPRQDPVQWTARVTSAAGKRQFEG